MKALTGIETVVLSAAFCTPAHVGTILRDAGPNIKAFFLNIFAWSVWRDRWLISCLQLLGFQSRSLLQVLQLLP